MDFFRCRECYTFGLHFVTVLFYTKHIWLAGLSKIDYKTGESLFVILTRPAWSGISFIHDRMPVILPKEKHDEWLNGHGPLSTMGKAVDEMNFKMV
ncbi:SOS response-associated peptidase family protein [Lacrimispora indolis]|uniref:SOS response-associated peptidase family protein n=1 Tax=Lacrimispora indolis TaxID=69825 RepID=UPI000462E797|nr:SOS response-associated peptidase family protein [[Clostridium] methoxybenzovorans]